MLIFVNVWININVIDVNLNISEVFIAKIIIDSENEIY